MSATDWAVWIGYELAIVIVVFAKTVFWFRHSVRDVRSALVSWVGLLLVAFFAAIALCQRREQGFLAGLVAFGLAGAIIVSAAVNASFELGRKNAGR